MKEEIVMQTEQALDPLQLLIEHTEESMMLQLLY